MVVSKRCKICTALEAENIPISGEYFGKLLPDLILKISGVELDPRKATGVLICQQCAIQLIHIDVVVDKLRNSLQRLKKLVKETKPKTPSKDFVEKANKSKELKQAPSDNTEKSESSENNAQPNLDDTNAGDRESLKNSKKVCKPKLIYPGENVNGDTTSLEISNFKKILDNDEILPAEKKPSKTSKRKFTSIDIINKSNNISSTDAVDYTSQKRNKKTSISLKEQAPLNLTIDEQNCEAPNGEPDAKENKIKVLNCVLCGKRFNQKSLLRDHIETSHMGEKLKECPHCSTEFRSQQKYESHVFSEKCKNTLHACQYPNCNKHFKTVHKMELHMQQKHSSQNMSEVE